jgi:3-deoxy-D-manno-octulosonic-acid transferase
VSVARGAAPAPGAPSWYSLAWLAGMPVAALYLLWRSLRQPDYLRHWAERFLGRGIVTHGAADRGAPLIWLHAVSVGETRAAQPLVELLARRHPAARFLLTHMTPTGRAAGADLARGLPGRVQQRYLPYDLPFAVRRFLRETRPALGVLMETEVWPNLLHAARAQGLPVVLANARLSPRSLRRAMHYPALVRGAAAGLRAVGAQSAADAERLRRLYDGPVEVTGNLKFDQRPDEAMLERGGQLRAALRRRYAAPVGAPPIWLFASTREGEERLLIEALTSRAHLAGTPAPLVLFVPRHPQRFAEVAALLASAGGRVLRRAEFAAPAADGAGPAPWLLGDSMGEMPLYYAMADVALIGGSLLPLGGQNLIEACACGCPVVLGPHMFNFAQAAADALAAGAATDAADAAAALAAMARIAADAGERARRSDAARRFAAAHRGATQRTADMLDGCLVSAAAAN